MIGVFYNQKTLKNTLILVMKNDQIAREVFNEQYWIGFNNKDEVIGINIFSANKYHLNLSDGYLKFSEAICEVVYKLTHLCFKEYIDQNDFVVAKVTKCNDIPNSHLHQCKVFDGINTYDVVCGANNVRVNLKVVLAKINAVVPANGLIISKSKLLNYESCGMLCSAYELNLKNKFNEHGIIELSDQYQVGSQFNEIFINK